MNLWDFYGQTPLYAAVDMNTLPKGRRVELPALDETTGLEVITMLLDRGANPNSQLNLRLPWRQVPYDRYTEPLLNIGVTPLIRATKSGDLPVIKLLLAHGALPNLPNFNGDTPLMAACAKGWINSPTRGASYTEDQALEVYDVLRAAGADANARTHFNETALHSAALRGWNQIVKKLIADGAELDVKDGNGLTADRLRDGPHSEGLQRAQSGSAHRHGGVAEGLWCEGGTPEHCAQGARLGCRIFIPGCQLIRRCCRLNKEIRP